jgi:hypothetical protein
VLTGIHFILTYRCTFECDHCFVYCGPHSRGTFTIAQVQDVLDEARKMDTIDWVFFEGGEPLLYFALLQESIRRASTMGFRVGIVTSAYAARSEADAELWLRPLAEAGLSFINISNDVYHYGESSENPADIAEAVAGKLGIEAEAIRVEPPRIVTATPDSSGKGQPVTGGDVMFRGRAADLLADNLPRRDWREFRECPFEDLESPSRVHLDSFGHVQICQGISIGNLWETPLSEIMAGYRADAHAVCGPLLAGGPAELARELGAETAVGYISECHCCYSVRKAAIDRHPEELAPRQVYGLTDG